MHCGFCETGKIGYCYNLSSEDMYQALEYIINDNPNGNVKWVALMGMGEPLLNFENLKRFYYTVKKNYDLTLSLSTCGISPVIKELADSDVYYHLFISLHFSDDLIRSKHMPINKKYQIESIFQACDYYHSKRPDEKIEISYLMLEGINTSQNDLDKLIELTKKDYFLVQLLFYNAGNKPLNQYKRINMETAIEIDAYLKLHGVHSYLSVSAGQDIGGACGQMATKASNMKNADV
jgi:23S rRNA (adenine2503-C2)-methyltransferase